MVEHAGFTQPPLTGDNLIAQLFGALAAEDKLLEKHHIRRDNIVEELMSLGAL